MEKLQDKSAESHDKARELLSDADGRCFWESDIKGVGAVEMWLVNGRNLIVIYYTEGGTGVFTDSGIPNKWGDLAAWLDNNPLDA